MHGTKLRKLNNTLSVIIVILAGYILIWPLLPSIDLWWGKSVAKNDGLVYVSETASDSQNDGAKPIPADNRLIIPSILLDTAINEGKTTAALKTGSWRRPATGTPASGGNTVIVGHRFTYDGQSYFYNLDKVSIGDTIIVYWQGKEYDYRVSEIAVVPPETISVEAPTPESRLTLYTCTPLWSAKDRLVIIAYPEEG